MKIVGKRLLKIIQKKKNYKIYGNHEVYSGDVMIFRMKIKTVINNYIIMISLNMTFFWTQDTQGVNYLFTGCPTSLDWVTQKTYLKKCPVS